MRLSILKVSHYFQSVTSTTHSLLLSTYNSILFFPRGSGFDQSPPVSRTILFPHISYLTLSHSHLSLIPFFLWLSDCSSLHLRINPSLLFTVIVIFKKPFLGQTLQTAPYLLSPVVIMHSLSSHSEKWLPYLSLYFESWKNNMLVKFQDLFSDLDLVLQPEYLTQKIFPRSPSSLTYHSLLLLLLIPLGFLFSGSPFDWPFYGCNHLLYIL